MKQILLVGCGNLGKAFLKAWSQNSEIQQIKVIQPSLSAQNVFSTSPQISFYAHADGLPTDFKPDVVVLAFKPYHLEEGIKALERFFSEVCFVSLLAGVSMQKLKACSGSDTRWVRIMPNVAAEMGQSANLAFGARGECEALFVSTGPLFWMPTESLFDSMTAISGCGPAYFYLMAEIMAHVAVQLGLEQKTADSLVKQTLLGSASLLKPETAFKDLRNSVTSKGGMTEAALSVLGAPLRQSLEQAIHAALKRMIKIPQ